MSQVYSSEEPSINFKLIGGISITVLAAVVFYFGGLEARMRVVESNGAKLEELSRIIQEQTIAINQLKFEMQMRNHESRR